MKQKHMPYLYVKQKVGDFEKWYTVFKSHEPAQKEAGLKDLKLFKDSDDENTIICMFRIDSSHYKCEASAKEI